MEIFPLISIPAIYFTVAFIKPYLQPKTSFRICAVCIAVLTTWLALLILRLVGYEVSTTILATLMGMSIAGIMYRAEAFYAEKKIRNFWFVRLVIVIGGLYAIIKLLEEDWNTFTFVLILSLILIALASLLFQGITHETVLEEHSKNPKKSIIKKLDDCC